MRLGLLSLISVAGVFGSFCGDSAIPYSFEVLSDGQPVLGCARPTCFGWDPSGLPASHTATFYRIHKKPDGFLRKERASIPPFVPGDIHFYHPQTAECDDTYTSMTCDQDYQWVGGISPLLNVTAAPTALQCCSFEPLKLSVDRGVATVTPGQIVVGGEASKKGKQFAFDYISGVSKTIEQDGTVSYEVNIRRFPCLPLPNRKAYQAPVENAITPIQVQNDIEGPFDAEGAPQEASNLVPNPAPQTSNIQSQFQVNQAQAPPPMLISGQVPVAQSAGVASFQPQPFGPAPYVPQNYYNPTTPGAYYCFSKDTTVLTIEGVQKRMDELKVGDWIQTIEDEKMVFSKVSIWLHKNPEQDAVFHKLTLEDGRILKLTGKHYIFKTKCVAYPEVPLKEVAFGAVFAETVEVGDCLYTLFEEKTMKRAKVINVEKVKETGIYSPLVSQGKLMVNGILASCHSVVQSNTLQQTFFSYVDHFFSLTQWAFGSWADDIRELPMGMDLLTSLMDQVLPKNLVTL